jgi:hypothetical protein
MSDYLVTLILTIIIEVGTAALLGYTSYVAIRTVVLLNLMSHPLLSYFLALNEHFGFFDYSSSVLILETLVVFGEFGGLLYVLREDPKNLFILSVSMNLASFLIRLLLFPIWESSKSLSPF